MEYFYEAIVESLYNEKVVTGVFKSKACNHSEAFNECIRYLGRADFVKIVRFEPLPPCVNQEDGEPIEDIKVGGTC